MDAKIPKQLRNVSPGYRQKNRVSRSTGLTPDENDCVSERYLSRTGHFYPVPKGHFGHFIIDILKF
jgi:hypothetical protein